LGLRLLKSWVIISVDTSASPFREGCVGRDVAGLVALGLHCRHQLQAEAAGFALQGGEVALLPALLKFRGAAVNPNLSLGNQPIVQAGQDAGHGLGGFQSPNLARRYRYRAPR
jgi:hypothetical protein